MKIELGKAGRKRWKGVAARPRRRDEPGRSPDGWRRRPRSGGRHPCSPTGKLAKGGKTRKSGSLRRRRSSGDANHGGMDS